MTRCQPFWHIVSEFKCRRRIINKETSETKSFPEAVKEIPKGWCTGKEGLQYWCQGKSDDTINRIWNALDIYMMIEEKLAKLEPETAQATLETTPKGGVTKKPPVKKPVPIHVALPERVIRPLASLRKPVEGVKPFDTIPDIKTQSKVIDLLLPHIKSGSRITLPDVERAIASAQGKEFKTKKEIQQEKWEQEERRSRQLKKEFYSLDTFY